MRLSHKLLGRFRGTPGIQRPTTVSAFKLTKLTECRYCGTSNEFSWSDYGDMENRGCEQDPPFIHMRSLSSTEYANYFSATETCACHAVCMAGIGKCSWPAVPQLLSQEPVSYCEKEKTAVSSVSLGCHIFKHGTPVKFLSTCQPRVTQHTDGAGAFPEQP